MAPRILVADNDCDVREVMVLLFECAGLEVVLASNPQEALELLEQCEIDVVVTDFRLIDNSDSSDRSGLHIYEAAMERGIPAILMSGSVYGIPPGFVFVQKGRVKPFLGKVREFLNQSS